MSIREEIKKILDPPGTDSDPGEGLLHSAVLLMLSEREGSHGIWFIRRTEYRKDIFSGHVAFPGGKKKQSDATLLDTAFREAGEELGFDTLKEVEILGEMDFMRPYTPSARRYAVKPFVGMVGSEVDFAPNYEVSEFFRVPVSHLLDPRNRNTRQRERDGTVLNDYVFTYRNHIIWGLTGRVLNEFFGKTSTCLVKY
ncbi:MAG: CoA pyrophosphatase [Candidatus Dadabacteria bacterium]|nr:CoA pyrophosphatase [Candidatus Dadabacteria bacterium]